jgi:Uma2 family endonuclease
LAYDQGLLEIMSPSYEHESIKSLLGWMVRVLCEEIDLPIRGAGSTTLERPDQQRGLEPDDCFFVGEHARDRRGPELDLIRDPPPDLAIDVDISRSSRIRLRVHAALGIPEVWCWRGDRLSMLRLQQDGRYREVERSELFPIVGVDVVERVVRRRHETDETQLARDFRAWVRSARSG